MTSAKQTARLAGFLYLLNGIPSVFAYIYMPGALTIAKGAERTAADVAATRDLEPLALTIP
jgi:hypothetical protein